MAPRRPSGGRFAAARTLAVTGLLTAGDFLLPSGGRLGTTVWAVVFIAGLVVLAALIAITIRRLLQAGQETRLLGLIVLLVVSVLFFAEAYYLLAREAGQFAGLRTRTDALYFTVSTLATVGFGDVHAAGQLARAAVTAQIVFDLVFLGTAAAVLTRLLRARAARRGPAGPGGPGGAPGPAGAPRRDG